MEEIKKKIKMQSRPVREMIYEELKEGILNGNYEPGFHLRERELAKEFDVSTTPIKEALRLLENDGLIVTQARKGSFVSTSVMSSVEEIRWARAALEGVSARLAAIKRTEEELEKLESIIKSMKIYTQERNSEMLEKYNSTFHDFIQQIAKNNYISNQINAVCSFDKFFRKRNMSDKEEHDRAFQDHFFIFEKIKEQDAVGAEDAMRNHINRSTTFALNKNKVNDE
ncbi:transcriptional regulator [Salipaludibacillus neizhouensis]|uniref:Transcriptional regulator n=1 Tax=Salipaludibacillus neizhouensis TaxID=885475 RepID=A0A3A9K3I6_9BACI|nr:GntR family transcriptional regulator [Salipaludibacillus neizhouensis]RKL65042.1 transcriptional regulator [Salipaludibacillus neizhouensis]